VPIYDYWREPDGAYLVMRWLKGGNLTTALRTGPWSFDAIGRLLDQIGGALGLAHRQGVVHRDIKLSNILLDEDGNAYLSDFGIAQDLTHVEQAEAPDTSPSGPSYASPEQLRREPASRLTDIYSLGVVLHELATGLHPFRDSTPSEPMERDLGHPLPQVSSIRSDVPPALDRVISRATAPNPADRYQDVASLIADFAAPGKDPAIGAPTPASASRNPYKGLRAFQQTDTGDFYGREALTDQILEKLRGHRLIAVVGPSGSGKSSVVKAGVLPAMRSGSVAGWESWFFTEMVPGSHPFEELEAALLRVAVNPPATLLEQLRTDDHGLSRAVKRILPEGDSELVLVIDQFEEVFSHVADTEVRKHLLAGLHVAATDERSRLRVIITLRADFFDQPLLYPEFAELIKAGLVTVTPLTGEELERAIIEPSHQAGMAFEPGLVGKIVANVSDQPGALPLLQYALTELFENRNGSSMTKDAYQAMGGALGALGKRAEELYQDLDGAGRAATRQLFLRLVNLGNGPEDDTRRRVLRSELLSLDGDHRPMEAAIEAYGRHRLLSFDRDPVTRGPTVEVAHEALLREWGRLRVWIEDSREDLAAHRRLATATEEWIHSERDEGFLLTGSRLAQVETWAANSGLALAATERDLLDASVYRRNAEETTETTRTEREAATERRSVRRLRALVAVLLLAVVATTALSLVALDRSRRAGREARAATVQSLTSAAFADLDVDPEASVLLALEAVDRLQAAGQEVPGDLLNVMDQALQNLRVRARFEPGLEADLSADGTMVATAGVDGELLLWEAGSGDPIEELTGVGDEHVASLKFAPDGARLATVRSDGRLQIWDAEARRLEREMTTAREPSDVSWSGDGSFVVVGGEGWWQVWDMATGELTDRRSLDFPDRLPTALNTDGLLAAYVDPVNNGVVIRLSNVDIRRTDGSSRVIARLAHPVDRAVCAISFDPSGNWIATGGSDGMVSIWNLNPVPLDADTLTFLNEPTALLGGHRGAVCALEWSADGTQLVTGGSDGTARLWDVASAREVIRLSGQGGAITSVSIGSSGRQVVTANADGFARLWDLSTGVAGDKVITEPGPVLKVVFGADGDRLAVSSVLRVAIWDLATRRETFAVEDEGGRLGGMGLALSDDGLLLASPFLKHSGIGVYNTASGELLRIVSSIDDGPYEMAFLPGTHELAAANQNTTLKVWDVDGESSASLLTGREHSETVVWLDSTPDGSRIVTSSPDGTAIVWESNALDVIATLEHGETELADVAISPDGQAVAVGTSRGVVQIWDVESETLERTLEGHIGLVNTVRFSPDGSRLATGGDDGTARVWDTSTWEQTRVFFGHESGVLDVAFSPDGSTLATAGRDGTVRLRILDPETLIAAARARVTRSLTDAECAAYLPSGTCD